MGALMKRWAIGLLVATGLMADGSTDKIFVGSYKIYNEKAIENVRSSVEKELISYKNDVQVAIRKIENYHAVVVDLNPMDSSKRKEILSKVRSMKGNSGAYLIKGDKDTSVKEVARPTISEDSVPANKKEAKQTKLEKSGTMLEAAFKEKGDEAASLNSFLAQKDAEAIEKNNATLKKAVTTAIGLNYRIRQARERVVQAEHSTKEAYASYYPEVDASLGPQKKSTKGFDTQKYDQGKAELVTTYNLFSSGVHEETVNRTRITKQEQEERYRGTLEEEILKVVDAYFGVAYGRLAVEVNKNNYEKLLKILEIVQIKRELGAATKGDENSILASVSNAKTALINTESSYNNARDYYEFLTSLKLEDLNPYELNFETKLSSFDELFNEIKRNNTELSIIEKQIEGKQKDVEISNSINGLKIDFTMSNARRLRNDRMLVEKPTEGHNTDYTAELTFSLKLFDGGRQEARSAKLLSEASALIYNLEYTKQDTKWNSQKLYNSVQTNTRTIETLDTEIDASRKMADAYWEKFRLSSQDLVTLLQAQRQVNSAELEKIRSEKTRLTDYFSLLSKQGKLVEYFGY